MIPLALFAAAGCLALGAGSDHITAGDFATSWPEFAALAPATGIAPAPPPGGTRIFRAAELHRLAARLHVDGVPEGEICFVRPAAPLDSARILSAMRRELPKANIELLAFTREPAPDGEIEFPLAGLRPEGEDAFWSGSIRYAGTRRFPVWAHVRVLVSTTRVIARANLRAGQALDPTQFSIETRERFPAPGFAASPEEVAGKVLRRSVRSGEAIRSDWLDAPKEVMRGDIVHVQVRAGAMRLELDARAEGSGSTGQTIAVSNPLTHRRFRARIEGKGRVTLQKGDL